MLDDADDLTVLSTLSPDEPFFSIIDGRVVACVNSKIFPMVIFLNYLAKSIDEPSSSTPYDDERDRVGPEMALITKVKAKMSMDEIKAKIDYFFTTLAPELYQLPRS